MSKSPHYEPHHERDHEGRHVLGGADAIDSGLDARALNLVNQGEIIFRAAAANTIGVLGVGAAGNVLICGGPAANPSWAAAAPPGAHEATHVLGGVDDIDSALDARAIALTAHGEIVYHAAAANTLAALAVGAAGQSLLSGGAGADISWGAPAPAAHEASHVLGGGDAIDSGLDARALNLANQGEIVFRVAAANTLAALATGAAGQALLSGGAGADISWGAPAPAAHAASHLDGAADEIDAADLAGAGGAAGEIIESDGAALSYVEPDGRYAPAAHRTTHEPEGADEVRGIDMPAVPGTNETGHGLEQTLTVGENFTAGQLGYKKADGKYWLSDADGVATMPAVVMAMEAILADASGRMLRVGPYRQDSWDWVVGNGEANLLWASVTPGAMSQDQPVGAGDQVQVVGHVETADSIYFNPSYELVEV